MKEYLLKTCEDGSNIYVSDVHKILLEMLEMIDKICQKHNIDYFLEAGTALGAVRHEGFIPWDDDADISMMYDEYLRFIEALKQDLPDGYVFQCFETHKKYNVLIPAMKIRKKGTYLKEVNSLLPNRCKDSDGVFVDVFIYDHASNKKRYDAPLRALNMCLMPVIIFFDILHINPLFLKKWFVSNARLYGRLNKKSEYIGMDITWTFKSLFKPYVYKKSDIFPTKKANFHGLQLPIPNNHHAFLCTSIAPSYMQFPKEKDQAPKHIVDIEI